MLMWLWRTFVGCRGCHFEQIRELGVYSQAGDKMPTSIEYHMRCKTCGRMKFYTH